MFADAFIRTWIFYYAKIERISSFYQIGLGELPKKKLLCFLFKQIQNT